jgi:hypothetical protein
VTCRPAKSGALAIQTLLDPLLSKTHATVPARLAAVSSVGKGELNTCWTVNPWARATTGSSKKVMEIRQRDTNRKRVLQFVGRPNSIYGKPRMILAEVADAQITAAGGDAEPLR